MYRLGFGRQQVATLSQQLVKLADKQASAVRRIPPTFAVPATNASNDVPSACQPPCATTALALHLAHGARRLARAHPKTHNQWCGINAPSTNVVVLQHPYRASLQQRVSNQPHVRMLCREAVDKHNQRQFARRRRRSLLSSTLRVPQSEMGHPPWQLRRLVR